MSIDQNKAVVRRFMTDVLEGGELDVVDQILAADYVNSSMGNIDRAAFKGVLQGLVEAMPKRRFEIEELIAEGDAVVARFKAEMTDVKGVTALARGLAYYRIRNGQIVEDQPITSPDLAVL